MEEEKVIVPEEAAPAEETSAALPEETVAALPEETVPAPKKSKAPKIIAAILAAAVVIAGVCFIFRDKIDGFIKSNFGSAAEFNRHVNVEDIKSHTRFMSDKKDTADSDGTFGYDFELGIELGEDGRELLSNFAVGDDGFPDLRWLESLSVNGELDAADGLVGFDGKLGINGNDALTLSARAEKRTLYYSVAELGDEYSKTELEGDISSFINDLNSSLGEVSGLFAGDRLPVEKYADIIFESIDEVNKEKTTLKAGDLETECTALESVLDEETVKEICEKVLTTAKNDPELKKLLAEIDGDDVDEKIDEALEDLEDADLPENVSYITYVDGDKVIGRHFSDDDGTIDYAIVKDGRKYAAEFRLEIDEEEIVFEGDGVFSGDLYTGEHTLTINGTDFLTVETEKFDSRAFFDGEPAGTVTFRLADGIFELLGDDSSSSALMSILSGFGIRLTLGEETDRIDVVNGDDLYLGITFKGERTECDKVTLPEKIADEKSSWELAADAVKLASVLKDAGVPAEFIEEIAGGAIGEALTQN